MIELYELAKNQYEKIGVDVEKALKTLSEIKISIQCWQGDDVNGFVNDESLSGGIQVTGNYPGRARNVKELRQDLEFALKEIPGKHKVNLHAIYLDSKEVVEQDKIEPKHFASWVDWAKKLGLGLDFNPTCFSSPMLKNGFSLSSNDKEVRDYWIRHTKQCLKITEYFAKELNQKSVMNIWIPDGYKDTPIDRLTPRLRYKESLDEILSLPYSKDDVLVAIESKLFGIGAESYTTGSNEFVLGYAVKNNIGVCLDAGHFHPTEVISDKISSVLLFTNELLLHVSRPVRWDSDHVVILDDELFAIAQSLVRNNLIKRTHIGLDYFDATINRVASWIIGTRSMQKALLRALLEPNDYLKELEDKGDFTSRLAIVEELKSYPFGVIYDHFLEMNNCSTNWLEKVKKYEQEVLLLRK